jgi:SAM-dependent methyltransferase
MDISLHKKYHEVEESHWWFKGRRKLIEDTLESIFGKDKKLTILDFGCNSGFFVEQLRKKGHETFGTDVSEESVEYGSAKGIKKLFVVKDKEKLPFPDSSFDVVMALDVLEHIENDLEALNELKRVVKPEGSIIVAVPAFPFLWGIQDEVAHHFRRYTKSSLRKLFLDAGLSIKRITFFNFTLFIPIAIVRMIAKIFPPKRGSDFELNNNFTNKILTKLFVFETQVLKKINFPWGISLLMIARK